MDQHREKASQFFASYVGAPSLAYGVTQLGLHDITHMTSFDNANEISLFAALAGSTLTAAAFRGGRSRLTLPLVAGLTGAAVALATGHSDLMAESWFLGGTGAFVTESLARGRRSSRKPAAPRK